MTPRTRLLVGLPLTLCGCFAYQPPLRAAVPAQRGVKLQSQLEFPVVMLDARGVATRCQVTELRGALVDRQRDTVRLATISARNRWKGLSPACATGASAAVAFVWAVGVALSQI